MSGPIVRLRKFWGDLRAGFWFLPSVIIACGALTAMAMIEWDAAVSNRWIDRWPRLFGSGAAGARGMLSTIAGSMMTVVGVTFSMTLITLALASSQYTSRILRNFMRDRVTQVVLGVFAGIFTYCLIALRTIRDGDKSAFIPSLTVSFGVVLAIGGIVVLIFFIHHTASSIQASNIIASVADETMAAIDRLFPEELGRGPADDDDADGRSAPDTAARRWHAVPARRSGYIESVDCAALLRLARAHGTVVRMDRGVGEFVVERTAIASLAQDEPPREELVAAVQGAFGIRRHRTVEQDVAFGIRQIVDMALRALSPGVNDTTTAVMCVDHLTAILARAASRSIPSPRRSQDGELRMIAVGPTFAALVAESFDQIRGSAGGNVAVLSGMLDAIRAIGGLTALPGRRQALRDHAQWIAELGRRTLESPRDRAVFEIRVSRVLESLDSK